MRRHLSAPPQVVKRFWFRDQTRGMALRLPEKLRDALRPRWLRVIHPDAQPDTRRTE